MLDRDFAIPVSRDVHRPGHVHPPADARHVVEVDPAVLPIDALDRGPVEWDIQRGRNRACSSHVDHAFGWSTLFEHSNPAIVREQPWPVLNPCRELESDVRPSLNAATDARIHIDIMLAAPSSGGAPRSTPCLP